MTNIPRAVLRLASRGDLALACVLAIVVFLMIMPVPTLLVDVFIGVNITAAVMLLMVGVYIKNPLEFSAFPSVLLLSTLFRLALSITTTRLILLQANAGDIVYSFGNFVVAGNIVVGIVVFLIITIVQFVVITKGAERVAEVGARFSLDGMPGKQMSIDADLRSGIIDTDEAFQRRSNLERQSQLYGSMDGAMKFVKGDAIAGLCIIVVNIVGGITIGVLQHGLPISEALRIYTILTVGDGLVAQIPSLFVAISAGIVVTRVCAEDSDNLGSEIGSQILAHPDALLIAAATAFGFALLPGFPSLVFLVIGAVLGSTGLVIKNGQKQADVKQMTSSALKTERLHDSQPGVPLSPLTVCCSAVEPSPLLGNDLVWLNDELERLGLEYYEDLGVKFPEVHIRFDSSLPQGQFNVLVHGSDVCKDHLVNDCVLLDGPIEVATLLDLPIVSVIDNEQVERVWINRAHAQTLKSVGVQYLSAESVLVQRIDEVARQYADEFLGLQQTRQLLDGLEKHCPDLIKEALLNVPLAKLSAVLRRLVKEGVPIRDLRGILELLVAGGVGDRDVPTLGEYLRTQLADKVSPRYADDSQRLWALTLTSDLEEAIRASVRQTPQGSFLALDHAATQSLVSELRAACARIIHPTGQPVLLTSIDLRRYVGGLLAAENCRIPVLAFQEVIRSLQVIPSGTISGQRITTNVQPSAGGS